MKNVLIYSLLFVVSLVNAPINARVTAFRGVSMADGLSDLLVNVIYKDSIGFVWLGTDNCLNRFDGVNIKHYTFSGVDPKHKRVTSIAEMDNRYLWVGNGAGLWRLNRHTEVIEHIVPETIDCAVSAIYFDGNSRLYIGTEKGLFIYEEGNFRQVMLDSNILSSRNNIVALDINSDGMLWLVTTGELHSFNPKTEEKELCIPPLRCVFRCITRIDKTLYLGTENMGVIAYDIPSQEFSPFVSVGCNIISSISSNDKDLIYVSTDGNGVHILSHSKEEIVQSFRHDARDKSSIRSNSVYSLLVDKENIIWIGFYQAGFDYSYHQSGLFSVYDYPPYFDSMNMQVRSFLIHEDKKLIGTRDGLFYIDETRKLVKSYLIPQLRANLILSINYYEGEYYIGTYGGGLSILNPATLSIQHFLVSDVAALQRGHVFCLEPDTKGNLWIGTSGGVYCYNKKENALKEYAHTNSQLPEGNVYEIFFDSTYKGWICTENGMALYDPSSESVKTNVFPESFVHKEKIRSIYEDSRQQLHFLPDKGSMFTSNLAMNGFYRTPMNPVLNGNAFMSIVEDDNNWLWLGCDDGLIRTKKEEEAYYIYSFSDGIPDPTFTNNAAYKDNDGVLWFGNAKGLLYVNPEDIDEVRRNPYKIVLTDIRVNGNLLTPEKKQKAILSKEVTLSHNQNNITFSFVNLSYSDPAAMVYEYKLDGIDSEWKHIAGQNSVSYFDLSSGSYVFRVRIPGDENSEVNISVVSPLRFPVSLLIVVLFVIIVFYWMGRKQVVRVKRQAMPRVLSREHVRETSSDSDPENAKATEEKYKTNRLTTEECKVISLKLSRYMSENRPYTNPDLKIADLAKAIDASSHSLSYLFNQHLNQSYYDYINEYRIEEFKKLVNNSQYSRYTLSALAELCGFSSRASFFRSFKKITGITPNEYIRSIGATNE